MSGSSNRARLLFGAGLGASLMVTSGCIGMRTPLDDDARVEKARDAGLAGACGVTTTNRTVHPVADVLIVLDRSSSMNRSLNTSDSCPIGATECVSRLNAVTARFVESTSARLRATLMQAFMEVADESD